MASSRSDDEPKPRAVRGSTLWTFPDGHTEGYAAGGEFWFHLKKEPSGWELASRSATGITERLSDFEPLRNADELTLLVAMALCIAEGAGPKVFSASPFEYGSVEQRQRFERRLASWIEEARLLDP